MEHVVITGADRGIGLSLTENFLRNGYTVYAGQFMPDWPQLDELQKQYPETLHILPLNVGDDASVISLTDEQNPKNLDFVENQAELLVNDLSDPTVDLAIINGNYILDAGLNTDDALLVESLENNPYANLLAWKSGSKDARIDKLEELLHSPEVKAFIEEQWPNGDVTPAF